MQAIAENPKKEKAITALLSCRTIAEAALQAGISERSIYGWLNDDDFQSDYRRARWQAAGQAIARLQQISTEAAEALQDVFTDTEAPASARVSAARAVLELSLRSIEIENHEIRITELERIINHE